MRDNALLRAVRDHTVDRQAALTRALRDVMDERLEKLTKEVSREPTGNADTAAHALAIGQIGNVLLSIAQSQATTAAALQQLTALWRETNSLLAELRATTVRKPRVMTIQHSDGTTAIVREK